MKWTSIKFFCLGVTFILSKIWCIGFSYWHNCMYKRYLRLCDTPALQKNLPWKNGELRVANHAFFEFLNFEQCYFYWLSHILSEFIFPWISMHYLTAFSSSSRKGITLFVNIFWQKIFLIKMAGKLCLRNKRNNTYLPLWKKKWIFFS